MSQLIHQYIRSIQSEFDTQQSTEHSFRSALKTLLESLAPNILALNESQRITGVGMPDFTIKDAKNTTINIGWIEAKDLYIDLDESKNADQLGRYLKAFDNFVYTNNLTFTFYRGGKKVETVSLGSASKAAITWNTSDLFDDNITKLERLLIDFLTHSGQTITSSDKLARAMAQKAQLIKYAIQTIFTTEADESALYHQYITFKEYLIHDLTTDQFADMYAQTIAYGLFAARLHDPTLPTFSREEAQRLIPKTTPFVKRLFAQMANDDEFDDRIRHIVDDLVHIFLHCDVATILSRYNRETGRDDPIIHFYETFLGEYDSAMRKKRGVYYTPEPVVQFIVRGVDHLLRESFGLKMGLADTSRVDHTYLEQGRKITKSVHRVQVLDPATGTGTFLDETVKYIHKTYFAGQSGIWKGYVTKDLLPRIRGFEILMASYTMAHLKLGLTIQDTLQDKVEGQGQVPASSLTREGFSLDQRFNIYLTNSLEQPHDNIGSLFAAQLARESEQASHVKTQQPIMVVMGNPPYSGISSNNGEWITKLIEDYKYVDGVHFGERKHWLQDDYVKFIRFAEQFVEKQGEGILAYINNHGFLDNPTFRGMRWHLLTTFDEIYIVDLHGNSKKKETSPDGSTDQNVFDIQAGVSIQYMIKTGRKKKGTLAKVYHTDVYGARDTKYAWLNQKTIADINWTEVHHNAPNYFFVPKDESGRKEYDKFTSLSDIFRNYKSGITTMGDGFAISENREILRNRLLDFKNNNYTAAQIKKQYKLGKNYGKRIVDNKAQIIINESKFTQIMYRPFDRRWTYYDNKILWRRRDETMSHIVNKNNICIVASKVNRQASLGYFFVSKFIADFHILDTAGDSTAVFPLYLYSTDLDGQQIRTPNLDSKLVAQICDGLGLQRDPLSSGGDKDSSSGGGTTKAPGNKYPWGEPLHRGMDASQAQHDRNTVDCHVASSLASRNDERNTIGPVDIFDYIYAVLHSSTYREMYAEFLKIDFPRVPFTTDTTIFWKMVACGRELRGYHLMESISMADVTAAGLSYPVDGDNVVEKPIYSASPGQGGSEGVLGRVHINSTQYISGVPQTAREFYVGGYQPAQKRLKDRKSQTLSYDDIMHYQQIIVALTQTARVMGEIDQIGLI